MDMPLPLLRRVLWRRRLNVARAWQEAARREAAEHNEAVRRIVEQGQTTPDPVGRPTPDPVRRPR